MYWDYEYGDGGRKNEAQEIEAPEIEVYEKLEHDTEIIRNKKKTDDEELQKLKTKKEKREDAEKKEVLRTIRPHSSRKLPIDIIDDDNDENNDDNNNDDNDTLFRLREGRLWD